MSQNELDSNITPRRDPGLISRIASVFNRSNPSTGPQVQDMQTSETGFMDPDHLNRMWIKSLSDSYDRMDVYRDVAEVDRQSGPANRALTIFANNVTSSPDGNIQSFQIRSEDESLVELLTSASIRANLYEQNPAFMRSAAKFGDAFIEILANEAKGLITGVKLLPPHSMHRNEDRYGNLMTGSPRFDTDGNCLNDSGECAFEQRSNDERVVAAFEAWQIVHVRFNYDGINKYGHSVLEVARNDWRRQKALEEGMVIARLVRAYLKLVYKVDVTGMTKDQAEEALKQFRSAVSNKQTVNNKRDNAFGVTTDLIMGGGYRKLGSEWKEEKSSVETIDPRNDGLSQIDDIKYFHDNFLASLIVPSAYFGLGNSTPTDMEDIQFVRETRRGQQLISSCLRQIFDIQLLLDGQNPLDAKYDIVWPAISTADEAAQADAFNKQAQAYALLLGFNSNNQKPVVDVEFILKNLLNLSDDAIADLQERLDEQHAQDMTDRMAIAAITGMKQNIETAQDPEVAEAQAKGTTTGAPSKAIPVKKEDMAAKVRQGASTVRQESVDISVRLLAERIRSKPEHLFSQRGHAGIPLIKKD